MAIRTYADVIDQLQEDFPMTFTHKPDPKVFFDDDQEKEFIKVAMIKYGVSSYVAKKAMAKWKEGYRWEKACKFYQSKSAATKRRLPKERVDCIINMLSKDFPNLFNLKSPVLLKIGIHKDLKDWRKINDVSVRELNAIMHIWVKRKSYQDLLKKCNQKTNAVRYGLDMSEYPVDFTSYKQKREKGE